MSLESPKTGMRNWRIGNWGTDGVFLNIGIWKSNKSSLALTPLTGFRHMICDNCYPTHCPGDNLGNVADEYSKTYPAVVGDHAPLQWWPALNDCKSPKVHNPHPHRTELPAGHHSVPQQPLHPLSSPAHLSFSYASCPKGLESHHHRTPDARAFPSRLRSTALSLLP